MVINPTFETPSLPLNLKIRVTRKLLYLPTSTEKLSVETVIFNTTRETLFTKKRSISNIDVTRRTTTNKHTCTYKSIKLSVTPVLTLGPLTSVLHIEQETVTGLFNGNFLISIQITSSATKFLIRGNIKLVKLTTESVDSVFET